MLAVLQQVARRKGVLEKNAGLVCRCSRVARRKGVLETQYSPWDGTQLVARRKGVLEIGWRCYLQGQIVARRKGVLENNELNNLINICSCTPQRRLRNLKLRARVSIIRLHAAKAS